MEEFTNLIAQAQHNPTWNVYLCWLIIFIFIYQHFVKSIKGFESFNEYEKKRFEDHKLVVNGEFTLLWKLSPITSPVLIGVCHDVFVVLFNQEEFIIVVYNKMFFGQFLSFTTISNLLT